MTPNVLRLLGAAAIVLALPPRATLAQNARVAAVAVIVAPAAAATTPHALATTSIVAGEQYRAGAMRRWILGETYRDLWTTAMRVPLLDLDTYAGGLKPLKAGGGMQTKSLRLVAHDGAEYVFRCVQKDHAWSVPDAFKGSVVERMSRDQVSTGHPAGALVVAPLMEAAGVLHATPILVVMPADAHLGEFTRDFAGQLGILEPYPHKPDSAAGFANAAQIIDSENLLKKLNEDPAERVDATAFLAARLVDMLVGDWDRHPGQWKWARMQAGTTGAWVAIPRDHDMAFVTYDGVIAKVGRVFSPVSAKFSGSSATIRALTWNSLELDRRLLGSLQRPAWDSVVADVTRRVTDATIDSAVAMLPGEFQASQARLASDIKERRTRLPALANAFYALVFDVADIHATDQAERATITRVADGVVDVRVQSRTGVRSFERRYDARETKEIRLYLHGGDDSAIVVGDVGRSIPVRIVGGDGANSLVDSATVGGKRNRAFLYDAGTTAGVSYGKDTLFNRQHWERTDGKPEPAGRDRGRALVPGGGVSAHRGMGITPHIALTRYDYGFERRPYASRIELEAEYAAAIRGFRFVARADRRLESSPVHLTAMARMSRLELINYYGLGNSSSDSGADDGRFLARQRQLVFHPAVAIALGARGDVSIGPIVQYSSTDSTGGQLLSTARPYGFGKFGQAGMQIIMHHDVLDRAKDPTQRFMLDVNGTYFPALWNVKSPFEALSVAVEGALTLPVAVRPLFVFRGGARKVFGDYPFHEAAFVGGNHTARYMEGQRYAGDASVYGSTELRLPVTTVSIMLPLDVGILALAEGGRVSVRGESPGGWHAVTGGGLWFSLRGAHMRVVTVTMTSEAGHGGVHLRTGLGF